MSAPPVPMPHTGIHQHDPFVVLGALIAADVPGLTILIGPQPANVLQVWPSLSILSGGFKAVPSQMEKIDRDPTTGALRHYRVPGTLADHRVDIVYRCGFWQGTVKLRIGGTSPIMRRRLEQCVVNSFNANERRGRHMARVPGCANAWHSWDVVATSWQDEMVFDAASWSEISLRARHPILAELGSVGIIEQLQYHFSNSESPWDDIPSGEIETVTINPDGTIERA
jgi:hypothetical protein